jgi:hypothetical protein
MERGACVGFLDWEGKRIDDRLHIRYNTLVAFRRLWDFLLRAARQPEIETLAVSAGLCRFCAFWQTCVSRNVSCALRLGIAFYSVASYHWQKWPLLSSKALYWNDCSAPARKSATGAVILSRTCGFSL